MVRPGTDVENWLLKATLPWKGPMDVTVRVTEVLDPCDRVTDDKGPVRLKSQGYLRHHENRRLRW